MFISIAMGYTKEKTFSYKIICMWIPLYCWVVDHTLGSNKNDHDRDGVDIKNSVVF